VKWLTEFVLHILRDDGDGNDGAVGGGSDGIVCSSLSVVCRVQCPVPQLTVTTAAVADNEAKHHVCPSRPGVADLGRRMSTPVTPSLARPPAAVDRMSPGRVSMCADLPSKPRLDSLFNTHGDIAKFRQLLRESTDETATEERVNYCCEVTTARIETWLRAVCAARRTKGGLCRQTADESLESEQSIMKLRNDDTEPDVQH